MALRLTLLPRTPVGMEGGELLVVSSSQAPTQDAPPTYRFVVNSEEMTSGLSGFTPLTYKD